MADTLSVDAKLSLAWLFQNPLSLSNISEQSKLEYSVSVADGTSASQADTLWHDQRTITTGAGSETLDLSGLTYDVHGSTVTIDFAKVKYIFIKNNTATTGDELLVGGAAANPFEAPFGGTSGSKVQVGPNSPLFWGNVVDGWTVSTDVNLKIENTGTADITYDIVIVGTTA